MGSTHTYRCRAVTQNDCENLRLLPSLPPPQSRHLLKVAPGKSSGDPAYSSLQLRWTLRAQLDLLWEQNLPQPLRLVLGGRTPSSLRRLEEQPLRGGGRGQTRGRNAQLLSRSRPRWEREWKVTGACSPSSAGSTRTETRTTRLLLLT